MLRILFISFYFLPGILCMHPQLLDSSKYFMLKNLDSMKSPTCGYASCPKPKPGMLNVHLIPHTHDDVGWLKTVDQYYYGSQSMTQKAGVQYILDSVVQELLHDPNKRFIYVETAYFWKWWKQQHDIVKHQVKKLVLSGQLEFTGGGWSMNDEAVTHYQSIIDNMSWGFRKLNDSFGECATPRVGWQIDPFGHSREMASLFAQMGFDGLFFGRLDYDDKYNRLKSKSAEMIWEGSANLGKLGQLFTSVLFNNYSPPPGFCFDVLCADEPFIDDKHSPDYNVDKKVAMFNKYAEEQSHYYTTDNILMTMGGDFTYQDAHMWYKNMDKLIRHVNAKQGNGSRLNLFYSTPACYLKAVNEEERTWPVKKDDFFPYASDPHAYWTGYFTSRPTLKRFERMGNNFLQVCKQLYAIADLGPEDMVDLNTMREAMGIMQHHDAVTGTEKQNVAKDYARKLSEGFAECQLVAEAAISKISKYIKDGKNMNADKAEVPLNSCLKLNVSECEVSEKSSTFVVTVYNPLSRTVSKYVRFPVTGHSYSVKDPTGKEQITQLVRLPEPLVTLPGRSSKAAQELVFQAQDLPPLGYRSYFVTKLKNVVDEDDISYEYGTKFEIGDKKLRIRFNKYSGRVKSLTNDGQEMSFTQDFLYYKGFIGDNSKFENRSSGAYIFRPNGSTPIRISDAVKHKTYKGPLVEEVHQKFSDWVSQVIRIYKGENHAEFEWMVGPIPVNDGIGKEVISRFIYPVKSKGIFYTDSNGREILERKINFRPTWKLNVTEPAAGNYYPVTTRIMLRDEENEFAVVTDRAQGGSSLIDGEVELMVHRRLLHDDAFGVGEALNETENGKGLVARGKHYIIAGPINPSGNISLAAQERKLVQEQVLSPWLFFTPADGITFKKWSSTYRMEFSSLKKSLPANVQILTLEPWKGRSLLLRLEHIMEKDDDPELSKPVSIDLQEIFAPFSISSACETTLGANQWLDKSKRMDWKLDSNEIDEDSMQDYICGDHKLSISLAPMQIRSFIIEIEKNTQY